MSDDPRLVVLLLVLAGVFLVLLVATALLEARKSRKPRVTRWRQGRMGEP